MTDLPPRRRNGKTSALPALAAGLLLFAVAVGLLFIALRPVALRIAVGPAGSDDHKLIQALAQSFTRDGSAVRLVPVTTGGAAESIAQLTASKADLAVARGDLAMPADAQSVAIVRRNLVVLWSAPGVRTDGARKSAAPKNRIKEIADLAGRRVGVIGRSEANVVLLRVILAESGVDPKKVEITQFGADQINELASNPQIDAFMTVGPLDSKVVTEAIAATARARGEPRFLPVDVSEAIAQRHPLYESEEIAGSSFNSSPARPGDKIETVGINHLIIAPSTLSDTTVGSFVRQLFAVRPQLARDMPSAAKIAKPDTDKDAALPAHPGAAAFIDGTERTFLEKYSDYIWAAVLLLSGFGSAGAWLRHTWRRAERERNTQHRDKLLDAISKVRQADSVEELAAMQHEVDEILRETLDCYDDGAIEAGGLSAFGLVMEQFHHAVVDRRVLIEGHATDRLRLRAR
ncbi:TAXI family TRAP transporter solute-binding subunit [Bradyrhizobium prioriisuperbiae]|uniref:TAXI family TRAP transporter solute-binding subunit n=1 Tax=Bradyrhizobium prioriisuperbiae TaxID=2854389 RepID=UPI0028E1C93C|nr:TAXI family TRAP transporter solute-binding subunit [Bradyrhizobium prioritasuperba]